MVPAAVGECHNAYTFNFHIFSRGIPATHGIRPEVPFMLTVRCRHEALNVVVLVLCNLISY